MKLGNKLNVATSEILMRKNRQIVWLITIAVVAFLIWASYAPLDEVVRGTGKVVPTMKNQIVQNLEGGIVDNIFVTEGDIVEAGQLIAKMDETRFQSSYQELQEQRLALLLRLARLEAEKDFSHQFVPDPDLAGQAEEYAASEIALYQARRAEINSSLKNLQDAMLLKTQEVDLLRPMAERAAIPVIELVRAEQAIVDVKSRIDTVRSEFEAARAQNYADTLVKLRQIEEQIRSSADKLARTNVRSPVKGIINEVMATTIGGVVRPGDPLVEILPLEEQLRIEGRIDPRDIGFVFVGMPATLKLTAFDFSIYGTLPGVVVHVGADTIVDDNQRDYSYYEVFIELNRTTLKGAGKELEIRPGMQAQIELEAGKKTVLKYILKPLFKATEALNER